MIPELITSQKPVQAGPFAVLSRTRISRRVLVVYAFVAAKILKATEGVAASSAAETRSGWSHGIDRSRWRRHARQGSWDILRPYKREHVGCNGEALVFRSETDVGESFEFDVILCNNGGHIKAVDGVKRCVVGLEGSDPRLEVLDLRHDGVGVQSDRSAVRPRIVGGGGNPGGLRQVTEKKNTYIEVSAELLAPLVLLMPPDWLSWPSRISSREA